ncbi:hypothetical protein [Miniphocaeibacter halophilus]|uniref:Uncharacterized protein n=1 Tax=Miniphocaeibacter halophilus TaxID=2931922 RepID=A0AC61MYW0_9FIRM|nr:hypothetical protein [Miniphocaeibacter halophilus]QQK08521.1 hypothetical protein JFY71_03005 [Miniphocaeibacter halophilus]
MFLDVESNMEISLKTQNKDYNKILKALYEYCDYFILADSTFSYWNRELKNKFNDYINNFKEDILLEEYSNSWPGTISEGEARIVKINFSKEAYNFLKKNGPFIVENNYYSFQNTDFQLDISFFKELGNNNFTKDELVFYTITHEGIINISNKLNY